MRWVRRFAAAKNTFEKPIYQNASIVVRETIADAEVDFMQISEKGG